MALSPSCGEEKGPTTEAVSKYDLMSAIRLGSSCLDLVCDLMTTLSVATAGEVKADAEEVRYRTVCCRTAAQPHVHYKLHLSQLTRVVSARTPWMYSVWFGLVLPSIYPLVFACDHRALLTVP